MRGSYFLLLVSALSLVLGGCNGNTSASPMNSQPGLAHSPSGGGFAPSGSSNTPKSAFALKPQSSTAAMAGDPGPVAIWVNRKDRAQSRIMGIDSTGLLTLFGIDGKKIVDLADLEEAIAVDVEYDFGLSNQVVDLVVVGAGSRLAIYAVDPTTGTPRDVSGATGVLQGEESEAAQIASLALYRQGNGDVFALVAPKSGEVAQYQLLATGERVDLKLIRRFGSNAQAVTVDDELGLVYLAGPTGIAKYSAAPDASSKPIASFGESDYKGAQDGMAILTSAPGEGFVLSLSRGKPESQLTLYSRQGPNEGDTVNKLIRSLPLPIGEGVGVAATSEALGAEHPVGVVVVADRANKRYSIFDWRDVQTALSSR